MEEFVYQKHPTLTPYSRDVESDETGVRLATPYEWPRIESFLDELGEKNVMVLGYHYRVNLEMLSLLDLGVQRIFLAFRNGVLEGVLPCIERNTVVGSVLTSLPFFGPNAGCLTAEGVAPPLLAAAMNHAAHMPDPLAFTVYTPYGVEDPYDYRMALPDATVIERNTQFLPIENFVVSSSIAYDLRKAERLGLRVSAEINNDRVVRFLQLYEENCREASIPVKPKICIQYLMEQAKVNERVQVRFAELQGEVVGGLIALFGPKTASYYAPCTSRLHRHLQPNSLLISNLIKAAQDRGLKEWNWERSPSPSGGVYRFKEKWGSKTRPYWVFNHVFNLAAIEALGFEKLTEYFPHTFVYPFTRFRIGRAPFDSAQ